MSRLIFLFLLGSLSWGVPAQAQDPLRAPWSASLSLGQYPASLLVPRFEPWHPGLRLATTYHWSQVRRHHLTTSANLAYYRHPNLQHGIQLYTELGFQFTWPGGFRFTPLLLGAGYQLAIVDLPSLIFDPASQRYEQTTSLRQNLLIILGSDLGYETGWQVWQRPLSFTLSYRIQVHSPFINQTVPLLAYTPLLIGVSLPL